MPEVCEKCLFDIPKCFFLKKKRQEDEENLNRGGFVWTAKDSGLKRMSSRKKHEQLKLYILAKDMI